MGIRFRFEKDEGEEQPRVRVPRHLKDIKKAKEGFVLDWEKELGFKGDPFKEEILEPLSYFIAGYRDIREKINLFIIHDEKLGVVAGEPGSGKTTLLKWIFEELCKHSGKVAVFYISGKVAASENFIKSIAEPFLGFYEKKKYAKADHDNICELIKSKLARRKLILLMDDLYHLPAANIGFINKMLIYLPAQIIAAGNNEGLSSSKILELHKRADLISNNFTDKLKISLKGMSVDDCEDMLKKRIESVGGRDTDPFDRRFLSKIIKEADYNPREVLRLCKKYAIELSVKKEKAEDFQAYHMDKAEKGGEAAKEDEGFSEDIEAVDLGKKGSDYKIKVVRSGVPHIIVPEFDDEKKDAKKE